MLKRISSTSQQTLIRMRQSSGGRGNHHYPNNNTTTMMTSTNTHTTHSNNPWKTYREKQRRRKREQKAQHLEEQKQQLRQLLKPKPWSKDDQKRLKKLKRHKYQKSGTTSSSDNKIVATAATTSTSSRSTPPRSTEDRDRDGGVERSIEVVVDKKDRSRSLTESSRLLPPTNEISFRVNNKSRKEIVKELESQLHQHDQNTRITVTILLVVVLFIVLYVDVVLQKWYPFLYSNIILRSISTMIHLSACGIIHFTLCDISILYTFSSFELTMKTGQQIQNYFHEQIHGIVAMMSSALVIASFLQAVCIALGRIIYWLIGLGIDAIMEKCYDILEYMLEYMYDFYSTLCSELVIFAKDCIHIGPSAAIAKAWNSLTKKLTAVCISIYALLMPFDEEETSRVASIITSPHDNDTAIEIGTAMMDNNNATNTWTESYIDLSTAPISDVETIRMDTIRICRSFLAYSAMFLITVLVGVNLLTSTYRHSNLLKQKQQEQQQEQSKKSVDNNKTKSNDDDDDDLDCQSTNDQSTFALSVLPYAGTEVSYSVSTHSPERPDTITISSPPKLAPMDEELLLAAEEVEC